MDFNKAKTSTIFLKYIIPQMIGLVFNSIYFIVDGVFIGNKLGSKVLASVGLTVPVVEISIAISMLIAVGGGILLSISKGQNDVDKGREIFNIVNKFTIILAIAIVILGNVFMMPLAKALGADSSTITDVVIYLRYYITFSPFLIFSFVLSTFIRNDDKPNLAMIALIIGALTNILLDYILMYPLNMGIAGAALATGLGPLFSVLILLPHFIKKKGDLYFEKSKLNKFILKRVFIEGLPAFIAEFSIGFVTLVYNKAILKQGLGDDGLAIYLVIGYASLIFLTSFLGVGQGVQPVISYLEGARNTKKIKSLFKSTVIFNLVLAIILYISMFVFGKYFYGFFIKDNTVLLTKTIKASKIYFLNIPFAGINILIISFLQSMSKSKDAMIVSLMRSTFMIIIFIIILPNILGEFGMWIAMTFAEILTVLASIYLWRKTINK